MLTLIKELFQLLTPSQRKRFYSLQILVVLMALFELIGIASITPFMALVGDITILEKENILANLYQLSGVTEPYTFMFWAGVLVLVMLSLSTLLSMFTIWKLSMFGAAVGSEIADRLYNHYLNQTWLFHASGSSAQLTKQIANEALRVTDAIIGPILQINARIALTLFLSLAIFFYNPLVAITALSIFALSYAIIYKIVRKRLQKNGQTISDVSVQRFRLMNEGFGGIKDVLLLGRKQDFITRFKESGKQFAYARGNTLVLNQVPRYFMELLAFGAMVGLVLYLILKNQGNLATILPILAVYALAGIKLLPAFQHIYAYIGSIKSNLSAYQAIRKDLIATMANQSKNTETFVTDSPSFKEAIIELDQVTFSYPNKRQPAVSGLTMTILPKSIIGIVGPSGSGKSTLIDLLLGLIQPDKGYLKINGHIINDKNCRAWQNTIAFVPQSIFLSEGTIAENVAFGVPEKEINLDQVQNALSLAHLYELVQSLDQGIHTKVGERGVQLSGGQRQRIGIARALYHEADVLIFDEATSALDGITEKLIMEAITDFAGKKTIIMIAHRLNTIKYCDQIYFIADGRVKDQGTFKQLLMTNKEFEVMANYA